jgi:hypothetical protein
MRKSIVSCIAIFFNACALPSDENDPTPTTVEAKQASDADTGEPEMVYDPQLIDNQDPKLLAVMRHQEALQPAVQVLYEEYVKDPNGGFAGIAFEDEGLTLYYKSQLTTTMKLALVEARKSGQITVKSAPFSMAELEAEGLKIHDALKAYGSSDIQSIGYMYDGSRLKIERVPEAVAKAWMEARMKSGKPALTSVETILFEAKLRVPVEVTTADTPIVHLTNRLSDLPPWNGGGRWESWRGIEHRGTCTTGFGVNASGRTWVLSAGHCASLGDTAYQGQFGNPNASFAQMGPINSDSWQYDMLLIDAPGWYLIFDGSPTTSVTKRVYTWGYWAANELVCQSGMTSGVVCGIKQQYSTDTRVSCDTPDSDGDCGYIQKGMIRSIQVNGATAGRPGDSGGPVFTLHNDGVRAKGIVSGGGGTTLYFQDWHDAIRLFGAYPRTP